MSRAAWWLLAAGALLFIVVSVWRDLPAILAVLALAGWGLVRALFHLVPLVLDAGGHPLVRSSACMRVPLRDALLARWIGESVNSLLPAGQIGGPVVMVRQLSQRGMRMRDAVAAITVSTTLQALAQIVFALVGVAAVRRLRRARRLHDLRRAR